MTLLFVIKVLYQSIQLKTCVKTKQQIFLGTFSILDNLSHCSCTTNKVDSIWGLKNMNSVLLAGLIQFSEKRRGEKEGKKR